MSIIASGTTSGTALVSTGNTNGNLVFQTNGTTTALTLATDQLATFAGKASFPSTIGVGGATPSASGSGITFPATTSVSSDVNTLDDYERGTWTASLGGTATYGSQSGTYVKIGRLVYATVSLSVTLIGTGSTTTVSGLPFIQSSPGNPGGMIGYFDSLASSVYSLYIKGNSGGTTFNVVGFTTAVNTAPTPAIFGNSTRVDINIVYYTNA